MGGMIGQWLGANAPERFAKIILSNTACYYPDPTNWHNRIKAVKEGGIAAVADSVIAGWLTADFREREPRIAANMRAMLVASPAQGYLACCEALSTLDQRALLGKIKSPTLVIAGRHDLATPVAAGEFIRGQIPGARLTILDAAHIIECRTAARLHRSCSRVPDATLIRGTNGRSKTPLRRARRQSCRGEQLGGTPGVGAAQGIDRLRSRCDLSTCSSVASKIDNCDSPLPPHTNHACDPGVHHEPHRLCIEWSQPKSARQTPTSHLRSRNSCRCRGRLPQGRRESSDLNFAFTSRTVNTRSSTGSTRQEKLRAAS